MNFKGQIQNIAEDDIVQIWLDTYDDMFSDFDPRPYSKRMWSDDFITQIKKVIRDRVKKVIILRILLPVKEKNEKVEIILVERLSEFFKQRKQEVIKVRKESFYRSFYYITAGIASMLITEYLSFIYQNKFSWHFFLGIFEPLGWFLIWTGLDIIIVTRKELHDITFFSKIAGSKIEFAMY